MNSSSIFHTLDWIVLGIYFLILIVVAVWVALQRNKNTEDYFLAGRNVGWFVIGASIFASNIGSEHVVGLAGTGFSSGTPLAHYELHAWIVLLLGWLFLPFYMRSGAFTMPEFLEKRFDSRSRWFLSVFSLFAYVLTKVSVTIYAGGIVVSELLNLDFWIGAIGIVVFTGIYTIIGGLKAVVYTETLQTVVLISGSVIITYLGFQEVGGWNELTKTVTEVSPDHFNMWRPMNDPDFPWTGLLIGGTIVGIWYWCTDQYIVQRTLAANNIMIGRRGAIFGAYLKLLPILIFLIPGIIAYALTLQNPEMFNVIDSNGVERADRAFPMLVTTLLPVGIKGLVAGGLMAALMSSLASVFNSCSTIFTIDIYKKIKPEKSEKYLVNIGKIATLVIVVLGIAWIPIMERIGGGVMYQYLQNVQAYIGPPVTAVFLLGIVWKRINAQASIVTLSAGLVLLIIRLSSEIYFQSEISSGLVVDSVFFEFATINFSHMAIFIFVFSALLCVTVSLLTDEPDYSKIKGLSFGTTNREMISKEKSYTNYDIIFSVLLVLLVIGILVFFSPIFF
ncbi:MAG: Na+/glucose cotransporter [Flavobacteriaceae bacterium]|nr:Na+/glucose cotransporter [Flavobacteriaceae bacterium]|tara:strand:- start:6785 stop:8467 length:1683 start_codon:yes stop_codon:yes gene_type:complete